MAARKKKKTARRKSAASAVDENLRELQKRLPKNLRGAVGDLRKNIKSLQSQVDRVRAERDARWQRLETQIRRDAARVLRRLEKAVAPASKGRKKPARRKPARKTARKKTTRKPARRKSATRRKTTRKKAARRR